MKQYIGISRDHSGSMSTLVGKAKADYNENISIIRDAAKEHDIDTVVSVIKCGTNYSNAFDVRNSSVASLKPLSSYDVSGGMTNLFDSVGNLVEELKKAPDADDPNVTFLVMVITDGQENASRKFDSRSISTLIKKLQATDRWTFTFRVPKGEAKVLESMGIPEGNILEWEQTNAGLGRATQATKEAVRNYYASRATGQRSTTSFYTDLSKLSVKEVKAELLNISKQVEFFDVFKESKIQDFVEKKTGKPMQIGCAFYQLMKPEKLQSYKMICIRSKKGGEVYSGYAARDLLNLPYKDEIRLRPGNHGDYDVFIQSTSTNRKLIPGTELLYWPKATSKV